MADFRAAFSKAMRAELRGALPQRTRLGNYEIGPVLGHGSFGITYRARDVKLDRDVALKEYLPADLALRADLLTVRPRSAANAGTFLVGRDRFVDEARTLAKFSDPAIVRVHDCLQANGTVYMVMDLAEGESLDRILKREKRLAPAVAERAFARLLDGLQQVHGGKILHLDIKPANIVLGRDGNPTLIDFGAARAALAPQAPSAPGVLSIDYAAAEQIDPSAVGPWTDIYGLAATLYHAVTARRPPRAVDRVVRDTYSSVTQQASVGYSPRLLAAIDSGLALKVGDRPRSITAWRLVVPTNSERALSGSRWRARLASVSQLARVRPPLLIASGAMVTIAALGIAFYAGTGPSPQAAVGTAQPATSVNGRLAEMKRLCFLEWMPNDDKMTGCDWLIRSGTVSGKELARAYGILGNSYLNKGDRKRAIQNLDRSIAIDPTFDVVFAVRGENHRMLNQPDRALEDFSRAIKLNDKSSDAYAGRGNVYLEAGRYDLALRDLDKADRLKPNVPITIGLRAAVYFCLKQIDRAFAEFNRAIDLDPTRPDLFNMRGNAYKLLGNYALAIADYSKAILLTPTDAVFYGNRAEAYHRLNQTDKALQDYNKAIELESELASAYNGRGRLYMNSNRPDLAWQDFDRAIRASDNFAEAYSNRGTANLQLKRIDAAIVDFDTALALTPSLVPALAGRSVARRLKGDIAGAQSDAAAAMSMLPLATNPWAK